MPGPTGPCGQLKVGSVIARRSRRCRVRQGLSKPRGLVLTARRLRGWFRRPGPRTVFACPKVLRTPRHQAGNSGLSDIAPSRLHRFEMEVCRSRPDLIPPPRGISPSRRAGSKIPSSSPAFRPLSRKGQSPSRCLEGASRRRFGQARDRPVIHFPAECQWTRVDNPTARRNCRKLSAIRLNHPRSRCARRRRRSALSLMKPAASCWS